MHKLSTIQSVVYFALDIYTRLFYRKFHSLLSMKYILDLAMEYRPQVRQGQYLASAMMSITYPCASYTFSLFQGSTGNLSYPYHSIVILLLNSLCIWHSTAIPYLTACCAYVSTQILYLVLLYNIPYHADLACVLYLDFQSSICIQASTLASPSIYIIILHFTVQDYLMTIYIDQI